MAILKNIFMENTVLLGSLQNRNLFKIWIILEII